MQISEFYNASCIQQFICPIAITLATDRVADVRTIAFKLVIPISFNSLLYSCNCCISKTHSRPMIHYLEVKPWPNGDESHRKF
jgi:hypothetical protein